MAAGTAYAKRYGGGFINRPSTSTPADSAFLNAVEAALLQLIGAAPTADGQVAQWDNVNTRYGPALLLNKNIDPAAAITYSKLALANSIVNADIAAGAAIAKSKLAALGIVDADVAVGAGIQASKIAGLSTPVTYRKLTPTTVNNSVAETDLLSGGITIGAGVTGATGVVRLTAWGDYLGNAGTIAPPRWKLKLGATTLIDTGASGITNSSATRYPWKLVAEIANSATNAQLISFYLKLSAVTFNQASQGAFTTGEGVYEGIYAGANIGSFTAHGLNTSAVDTTVANALVFSVINPTASVNCETKLIAALVEIL